MNVIRLVLILSSVFLMLAAESLVESEMLILGTRVIGLCILGFAIRMKHER